jgi:pyrimidine operon attenuation protein/uracil phosphoribosyltransferase
MEYRIKTVLVDTQGFDRTLTRLAHEIVERNRGTADLAIVGMQTRGVFLAKRLAEKIQAAEGIGIPLGTLDATLYRDDFRTRLKHPKAQITDIPFDIYDMNLILVDDVLYTGRTVRAALDALMDFGRPRRIQLAVLVDRGHREMPIRPDFIGKNIPTSMNEEVRVRMNEIDGEDAVLLVEVTP